MSTADGQRHPMDIYPQSLVVRYLFVLMLGITVGISGYSCLLKENTETLIVDTDIKSIEIEQTEADKMAAVGLVEHKAHVERVCRELSEAVPKALAEGKKELSISQCYGYHRSIEGELFPCLEKKGYIIRWHFMCHENYIDLSKYYE